LDSPSKVIKDLITGINAPKATFKGLTTDNTLDLLILSISSLGVTTIANNQLN
jgi:hypothetical protein